MGLIKFLSLTNDSVYLRGFFKKKKISETPGNKCRFSEFVIKRPSANHSNIRIYKNIFTQIWEYVRMYSSILQVKGIFTSTGWSNWWFVIKVKSWIRIHIKRKSIYWICVTVVIESILLKYFVRTAKLPEVMRSNAHNISIKFSIKLPIFSLL